LFLESHDLLLQHIPQPLLNKTFKIVEKIFMKNFPYLFI